MRSKIAETRLYAQQTLKKNVVSGSCISGAVTSCCDLTMYNLLSAAGLCVSVYELQDEAHCAGLFVNFECLRWSVLGVIWEFCFLLSNRTCNLWIHREVWIAVLCTHKPLSTAQPLLQIVSLPGSFKTHEFQILCGFILYLLAFCIRNNSARYCPGNFRSAKVERETFFHTGRCFISKVNPFSLMKPIAHPDSLEIENKFSRISD